MSAVTIRNLPDEVHRALKDRAARHGRSTEAEIREILQAAVRPPERVKVGSALAAFGRRFNGIEFEPMRASDPAEPASFE
ncbi:FitA-like ribbon-helix-helix domain-containing protein [Ancylobacter polymorphus]|uniref:Arc family DNA-binding protein n=1 Tax=Ancylobacter polymorphus TaxID=223390 RepID=A0A9E6ZYW6_9HYPH|nr:Arc family DNA-binding protein [Ancylobacter polymorphus]UOK71220.1 Arc family DNA-binding protein [Ancylobacter polymorphus]